MSICEYDAHSLVTIALKTYSSDAWRCPVNRIDCIGEADFQIAFLGFRFTVNILSGTRPSVWDTNVRTIISRLREMHYNRWNLSNANDLWSDSEILYVKNIVSVYLVR
jgi:hypothetical protein